MTDTNAHCSTTQFSVLFILLLLLLFGVLKLTHKIRSLTYKVKNNIKAGC